MKKGLFGSKQSDILNPLQNLIAFRSKLVINRESSNPLLLKHVTDIPVIENKEWTKLLKLKEPKAIFQKAAPKTKFNLELLRLLASDEIKPPTDDIFNTIFCYQFFAWLYLGLIDKQEQVIDFFLKGLIKIVCPSLQPVINSIFEVILNFITSSASFSYSDSMCDSINIIFQSNLTLEPTLFPIFLTIVKKLLTFENHVFNTLNTINTMLLQGSSIFNVPDNSNLIRILQPYILLLNPIALHILALIASKSKTVSQQLVDPFIMIIDSLVQSISFQKTSIYEIKFPPKDESNIIIPDLSSISPLTDDLKFLPEFSFIDNFKEPPYEIFNSAKPLSYFMSDRTKEVIQSISSCFKNVHYDYKETFLKMFVSHLRVSASTNLSVFAELVSAFLKLFETFGSPLLFQDSILPNLLKTVVFNRAIHVFLPYPIDLAINTFRETILNLIQKYCPKEISNFLKHLKTKVTNHQFLFIEMLGRLLNHPEWFSLNQIASHNLYITLMDLMREYQLMNMKHPENEVIKSARNTLYVFMSSLLLDPVIASSYISTQSFVQGYFVLIFEPSLTTSILHSTRDAMSKLSIEFTTNKNFNNLINFLISTINACKKNSNIDIKYQKLAESISHELATCLMHQSYLTLKFVSILPEYLDYITEYPSKDILSDMLNIFALYVASDANFSLSKAFLKKFSGAIRKVENETISTHTENILFSILKKGICCDCESLFLIAVPSILPLFISAYGSSTINSSKMIRLLHSLCNFADYNKIMCQNGEVNLILIQYMCLKAKTGSNDVIINYHGCEFSLVFTEFDIHNYVFPIIYMISNIKSENSEVRYIIDHLISYLDIEMCGFLMQLISRSRSIPYPIFSLGSDYIKFTVDNVFASDFEGCGMTISFMLYIDGECLKESNALISLITFTDVNNQVFGICLDKTTLIAKHENDSIRTTVNLIKKVPQSQWTTIYISIVFGSDIVHINNFLDHKKMNDSELSAIQFAPGELKIAVGGLDVDQNDSQTRNSFYLMSPGNWKKQQLAQIGDIKLFKGARTQDEIFQLYDTYRYKQMNHFIDDSTILFQSNVIKTPQSNSTYSIPRKVGKPSGILFAQSITDVIIKINNSPPSFQSIVDILINQNLCSQIVTYFNNMDQIELKSSTKDSFAGYSTMIINLIDELFQKSIETQIKFSQSDINLILRNLLNQKELKSSLYFAFYNTFQHISFAPLQKIFFEAFIMNLWLWCKCEFDDLIEIINHYSHVLIETYSTMFQENSYFSSLLNQSMLIFSIPKNHDNSLQTNSFIQNDNNDLIQTNNENAIQNDLIHMNNKNVLQTNTENLNDDSIHFLNKNYDDEMICCCQEQFFVFLARVAALNLKEGDIASLFGQISHDQSKMTLNNLLKLFYNISSSLLKVDNFLEICQPIIDDLLESNDVDIIEHALLIVLECYIADNMSTMIRIAFKFLKNDNRTEIFERMLQYIDKSPNMLIFESILAVGIKNDSIKKLSDQLNQIIEQKANESKLNQINENKDDSLETMWFMFTLIAALHANNDEIMSPICHYIILLLQTKISPRFYNTHCTSIFMFLSIMGTFTALPYKRVAVHLSKYLNKYGTQDQLGCIATNIFYFSIFRPNTKPGIIDEKDNQEKKQSKYHKILTNAFKESIFDECVDFVNDQSILTLPKGMCPSFVFTELTKPTLKSIMKSQFYLDLNFNKVDGNVYQLLNYAYSLMNQTDIFLENDLNLVEYIIKVICVKSTNSIPENEINSQPNDIENANEPIETTDQQNDMKLINQSNDIACDKLHLISMTLFDDIEASKGQYQKYMNHAIEIIQNRIAQIDCFIHNYSIKEKTDMDGIAEFQMKAEYKCHLDSIPQQHVCDNRMIVDQTLCSLLCPSKMKPITPQPFKRVEPIEFADVVIERPGILFSFNKQPTSINFKFNKKSIGIFSNSKNRYIDLTSLEYVFQSCNGNGCNFILFNGKSYLIDFKNDFPSIKKCLLNLKLPNCKSMLKIDFSDLQASWLNRKLSNFEYILKLNYIFGRSFRDRENYPIFPSLLTDFDNLKSIRSDFDNNLPEKIDFELNTQQSFNKNIFVRADYFFKPAAIDYVPNKWGRNQFDVVFKLRKLLESPEITENLHSWLHLAFGKQFKKIGKENDNGKITILNKFDIHGSSSISNIVAATLIDSHHFLILTNNGNACCVKILQSNPSQMNLDLVPIYKDTSHASKQNVSFPIFAALSTPFRALSTVSFDDISLSSNQNDDTFISMSSVIISSSLSSSNPNITDSSYQINNKCISLCETSSDTIKSVTSLVNIPSGNYSPNRKSCYNTSISPLSNRYIYSTNSGSTNSYSSYQNVYYGYSTKRIVVYSPDDNKVHLISEKKLVTSAVIFPEVPIIACCQNDIYYLSDACTITIISRSKASRTFASTTSRITALTTSETFHVLVIGTQDGFLHIYKEPRGELMKIIDLNDINEQTNDNFEILKILITPTWGLILVQTEGLLSVFDINGLHANTIKFTEPVLNWYGFTDSQLFDLVVFENEQHKIGLFDPIDENSVQYFYEAMEKTPLITFDASTNCFICLSENKQITFVPKPC